MSSQTGSNLVACRVCGTIMVKLARNICTKCSQIEEELFQKVKSYLRTNPDSSLLEVAKAVGCSEEQVDFFVQSGRLERIGAKVAHPCKICQKIVLEGIICPECKRGLKEQVTILVKDKTDSPDNDSQKGNPQNNGGNQEKVILPDKKKKQNGPGHVGKRKG